MGFCDARELSLDSVINKKTVIIGEILSGKTRVLARIVGEAVRRGLGRSLTILDFAPNYRSGGLEVGAPLLRYLSRGELRSVRKYLWDEGIRAPRLEGGDAGSILQLAEQNSRITTRMIQAYINEPTSMLVVNDLTIHIHAGDLELIASAIKKARTFIATAYHGTRLSREDDAGISNREREGLARVVRLVDMVCRV